MPILWKTIERVGSEDCFVGNELGDVVDGTSGGNAKLAHRAVDTFGLLHGVRQKRESIGERAYRRHVLIDERRRFRQRLSLPESMDVFAIRVQGPVEHRREHQRRGPARSTRFSSCW